MPRGAILECEICGRRGDCIPCVNSDFCRGGRCPVCFVQILEQPELYHRIWQLEFTCESCCAYGSQGIYVDVGELAPASSLPAASGPKQQSNKLTTQEKRLRSSDGKGKASKRRKALAAAAVPKPAAPKPAAKEPHPAGQVPAKPKAPAGAAGKAVDKKQQQQLARPKRPPDAPREQLCKHQVADQPPPKQQQPQQQPKPQQELKQRQQQPVHPPSPVVQQQQQQQQGNNAAAALGVGAPGSSGVAGSAGAKASGLVAAAAAALQAKSAAAVGSAGGSKQQPSGNGLFSLSSRSHTAGLGGQQQAGGSEQQQQQQQQQQRGMPTPAAASRLGNSHTAAQGGVPSSTGTAGKGSAQQQRQPQRQQQRRQLQPAGNSPLQPKWPTPGNSQEQQQQQQQVKQQDTQKQAAAAAGRGPPAVAASSSKPPADAGVCAASAALLARGNKVQSNMHQQQQAHSSGFGCMGGKQQQQQDSPRVPQGVQGSTAAGRSKAAAQQQQHRQGGGSRVSPSANGQAIAAPAAAAAAGHHLPVHHLAEQRRQQQQQVAAAPAATAQPRPFSLAKTMQGMNMAGRHAHSEELGDFPVQQDNAAPAVPVVPPPHAARTHTTCKFMVNTDSGMFDVNQVKVEVLLGSSLPPLLVNAAVRTDIEGYMHSRTMTKAKACREMGARVTPDFSRASVILREQAVGQLGKSLPRVIQAMVQGSKYVRLVEGGQSLYLAPVLKQLEGDRELVDYEHFKLATGDQEVFDRVFDDRLGVLNFLKPGELPTSALAAATSAATGEPGAAVGDSVGAGATAAVSAAAAAGGRKAWDANRPAVKSALKLSSVPASATPEGTAAGHMPSYGLWGDDDDFLAHGDHDTDNLGLGFGEGGFGACMAAAGFGAGMGMAGAGMGLAAGMDATSAAPAAAPNFMHDDAQDEFDDSLGLGRLQPVRSGGFPQQQPPQQPGVLQPSGSLHVSGSLPLAPARASGEMYSPTVAAQQRQWEQQQAAGAALYSPTEAAAAATAGAGAAPGTERPGVRFVGDGGAAIGLAAASGDVARRGGSSAPPADAAELGVQQPLPLPPPPPVQQQQVPPPPPPPQQQQQQRLQQHQQHQQQNSIGSIVAKVLSRRVKYSKLVPSLAGLCSFVNMHGLRGLRVHLDATITERGDRGEQLRAYLHSQGAVVTAFHNGIPPPAAGQVNILLVAREPVMKHGLEGTQLSLAGHLVAGMHVLSDMFMAQLQTAGNKVRVEDVEAPGLHMQFFAEGMHLLWDATLLRGSTPQELEAIVGALQAARTRLNAPAAKGLFKAYVRGNDRQAWLQLAQRFRAWGEAGIVEDLPADYQSSRRSCDIPAVIRDAVKAIHNINIFKFPLRYMVVVVPDTSPGTQLSTEDMEHIAAVLASASNHKTILAATRTQAIQLLGLLR